MIVPMARKTHKTKGSPGIGVKKKKAYDDYRLLERAELTKTVSLTLFGRLSQPC